MDHILIIFYIIVFIYVFFHKKEDKRFNNLWTASIIAVIWGILGKEQYNYNKNFLKLDNITLFPIFAWALGLFFVYQLYKKIEKNIPILRFRNKICTFITIYWTCLICIELIGYHILGIKNLATSQYKGILFFGCIHAPCWMQIVYFSLGPLYFITCYFDEKIATVTSQRGSPHLLKCYPKNKPPSTYS